MKSLIWKGLQQSYLYNGYNGDRLQQFYSCASFYGDTANINRQAKTNDT